MYLLNDLVSIAYAVPHLEGRDLHVLNEGRPEPGGAIAVLAPGTGLGRRSSRGRGRARRIPPREATRILRLSINCKSNCCVICMTVSITSVMSAFALDGGCRTSTASSRTPALMRNPTGLRSGWPRRLT